MNRRIAAEVQLLLWSPCTRCLAMEPGSERPVAPLSIAAIFAYNHHLVLKI